MGNKKKKQLQRWLTIIYLLLICVFIPLTATAHATLLKATPTHRSHLDHAPKKITLTFNERLGGNLYYLKVYNNDGKKITHHKATLSKQHHQLSLKLPS